MTQNIGALADAIDPRKCGRCEGTGRITVIMPNGTSIPNRTCKTCSGQGRVTPCIPPRKAAAIADALRSLTAAVEIGRAMERQRCAELVDRRAAICKKRMSDPGDAHVFYWDGGRIGLELASEDIIRSATPTPDVEALTEMVARALVKSHADNPDGDSFEDNAYLWQDYVEDATAVLRAIGIGGTAA